MDPQVTAPVVLTGPTDALLHLSSAFLREARFWKDPDRLRCGWALRHKTVDATEMATCELFEQLRARNLQNLYNEACSIAFDCAMRVLYGSCTQGQAAMQLAKWMQSRCPN